MFEKLREMGNCLTPSGWSLIFVGGGLAFFASKTSSIDLIKALCPDVFNNETNSDEGRRLMETEAEQRKLEEQRKFNEEQLRRRMQELDSEGFIKRFDIIDSMDNFESYGMIHIPLDPFQNHQKAKQSRTGVGEKVDCRIRKSKNDILIFYYCNAFLRICISFGHI